MSEPQRLHPAAAIIMALQIARQLIIPIILPLAIQMFGSGRDAISLKIAAIGILGVILFLLISGSWGILAWRRYTYRVEAGELRIEQGVINRKRRYIPLERIQSIDLTQGIPQRLFGIVSARVETASGGSARPEVFLPGVSRRDGEALQRLLAIRHINPVALELADAVLEAPPLPVRRLPIGDLLLAGSTAGRVGVALSIIGGIFTFADDAFVIERAVGLSERVTGAELLAGTLLTIAIAVWLIGVLGTVLAHAGFTVTRDGDHLLIERGLLERRRVTIPIQRIQAVRIVEGLLRQPLGLVELRVESAGGAAGRGKPASESGVLFPLLRRDEVLPFLREMAPLLAIETELQPLPTRSRRRYMTRLGLIIPAVLVAIIPAIVFFPTGLFALLAVPVAALLGLWQYHDAGWSVASDSLVVRDRELSRTTTVVPRRRIQQGETRQSIFQRRANLANFWIRVASGGQGSVTGMLHLDADDAARLLAWMSSPSRPVEHVSDKFLAPPS